MPATPDYICPLCQHVLTENERTLKCDNNHSFDYAKEGYVYLLPVQLKKSLAPGDDKNMVLARREFLQQGYYEFLRMALMEKIVEFPHQHIVDLGCGEGYYTNEIPKVEGTKKIYGVDISKPAVKYAAKRNPDVHYSVATNAHLPFADNSIDLISNVFAPLVGKECRRILKDNGNIISVTPGAQHLYELKTFIYDKVDLHEEAQAPEGFQVENSWPVEEEVTINSKEDILTLLSMTPFGWKISEENKQRLTLQLPFKLTLSFVINQFV